MIVYQDQVLHIMRQFAGYSLGEADVVRKAMGKKIASLMQQERESFVEGARKKGYDEPTAAAVFDLIEPFAGYAFNKAHSVSYAVVAYWTAYFKANHPVEFMTCVLNAYQGNDRMGPAVAECLRLGIPVLPPDVNRSGVDFSVDWAEGGREAVRFGLASIKNIGASAVAELVAERDENGPFQSLEDFCRRAGSEAANRRVVESLAKVGALGAFGSRGQLTASADNIVHLMQREARLRESGQSTMFDMFGASAPTPLAEIELLPAPEPSVRELVAWERELIGVALGRRVLDPVNAPAGAALSREEVEACADGDKVVLAGEVASVRYHAGQAGQADLLRGLGDIRRLCAGRGRVEPGVGEDRRAVGGRQPRATEREWCGTGETRPRYIATRRSSSNWRRRRPTRSLLPWPLPATPKVEEWKPPVEGDRERAVAPPCQRRGAGLDERNCPSHEEGPSVGSLDEGQRKVLVKMKETDQPSEDNRLLKLVLQTLLDYPGTDEVDLVIESGGQFWRISMPLIRNTVLRRARSARQRDVGRRLLKVEFESTAA